MPKARKFKRVLSAPIRCIARGLCPTCGKMPPAEGRRQCDSSGERRRAVERARDEKHRPTAFADPDRLDVGRDHGSLLAFGRGMHHCLGAAPRDTEVPSGGFTDLRRATLPRGAHPFVVAVFAIDCDPRRPTVGGRRSSSPPPSTSCCTCSRSTRSGRCSPHSQRPRRRTSPVRRRRPSKFGLPVLPMRFPGVGRLSIRK